MTFQFNGAITNITEWKMGLATPNGFTIEYAKMVISTEVDLGFICW